MIIFQPPQTTGMRQTLITGRVSDAGTDLGVELISASLSFAYSDGPDSMKTGLIPIALQTKPAGYFALTIEAGAYWPAFPQDLAVTLTVEVETASRDAVRKCVEVHSSDLQLETKTVTLDNITLPAERISGAPFSLSFTLPAAPVLLRAVVLNNNDTNRPVAQAAVQLDGTPLAKTN